MIINATGGGGESDGPIMTISTISNLTSLDSWLADVHIGDRLCANYMGISSSSDRVIGLDVDVIRITGTTNITVYFAGALSCYISSDSYYHLAKNFSISYNTSTNQVSGISWKYTASSSPPTSTTSKSLSRSNIGTFSTVIGIHRGVSS